MVRKSVPPTLSAISISASVYDCTEPICFDPKQVDQIWPHVRLLLKEACRRTGLSALSDIEADILAGRSLLWIAWNGREIEAAAATVLMNTENGKVCIITACGGTNMKRWLPLIGQIENYARNEGCARVRIYGRKGWLRALDGYRQQHVIMDKVLLE